MAKRLDISHINDFYYLEEQRREPVGGVARACAALDRHEAEVVQASGHAPLRLFSGDVFNPSIHSSSTLGSHMVIGLECLRFDAACPGNHDFDFGVHQAVLLMARTSFPWVLSNVLDASTGGIVANCREYVVLERGGLRIGVIGLMERETLETIPHFVPHVYRDFVDVAAELAPRLRQPVDAGGEGVDLVVALTHMRLPNDRRLTRSGYVDLVLGGHDHAYTVENRQPAAEQPDDHAVHRSLLTLPEPDVSEGPIRLVKSGSDLREITFLELTVAPRADTREPPATAELLGRAVRQPITRAVDPDPKVNAQVHDAVGEYIAKLNKPIAYADVPLDARSSTCRLEECNVGNFATDLMRLAYNAQAAFLVGGTIRSDTLYPAGELVLRDLLDIFPFDDPCVVVRLTGRQLHAAMENALSGLPKMEGKFPHISGFTMRYDSSRPPGQRVVDMTMVRELPHFCTREPVLDDEVYTVVTREYVRQGNEGFTMLADAPITVDEHEGMLLSAIVRRFLDGCAVVRRMKSFRRASDTALDPSDKFRFLAHESLRARDRLHHLVAGFETRHVTDSSEVSSDAEAQSMLSDVHDDAASGAAGPPGGLLSSSQLSSQTASDIVMSPGPSGGSLLVPPMLPIPERAHADPKEIKDGTAVDEALCGRVGLSRERLPHIAPIVDGRLRNIAKTPSP